MIQGKVEQILINSIKDVIPAEVKVSWPNFELGEAKSDVWYDIDILPATAYSVTLGDTGEDETRGILQVLFKCKQNTGTAEILKHRDDIAILYPSGESFTLDGVSVIIRGASSGAPFSSGEYYTVPLSIAYYARYQRR